MGLTIDLAAVQNNARIVAERCRTAGYRPQAVVKPAYAIPALLEAIEAGGIEAFAASTPAVARKIGSSIGRPCTLLALPSRGADACRHANVDASVHVRAVTAKRSAELCLDHTVWIEVMTSDGREGLQPEAALDALGALGSRASNRNRLGLLFNWGCLLKPPAFAEVQEAIYLARTATERSGTPIMLSLGGSALLPMLHAIPSSGTAILRIGEAIVSGSIPGCGETDIGLKPPIQLEAKIIDSRISTDFDRTSKQIILVDKGYTCLEAEDINLLGVASKVLNIYSESSLFEILDGASSVEWGQSVKITLGYRSSIKSLVNRQIGYSCIPNGYFQTSRRNNNEFMA